MTDARHILMVVKSGVTDDARIRREATALRDAGHRVTVIGDRPGGGSALAGITVHFARQAVARAPVARRSRWLRPVRWLLLPEHRRRDDRAFAAAVLEVQLGPTSVDLVHGHDLSGLVPAAALAQRFGAPTLYDSHECWLGRRLAGRPTPVARWRDGRVERRLGGEAAAVVTVSPGIARWLSDRHGFRDVRVVRNTFPRIDPPAHAPEPKEVLYAGRVDDDRDLDTVLEAVKATDARIGLRLIGPSDPGTARRLAAAGADVEPPIEIDALVERYREAGIGLVTLNDDQLNHRLALPNKLFQTIQAGVPVVASDLPEIAALVSEHGIGALYRPGDVASFRRALDDVLDRHPQLVANAARAAERIHWAHDAEVLVELVAEVLG